MKLEFIIFFIFLLSQLALTIEPITTTAAVIGSAALGVKYWDEIKLNSYCKFNECCMPDLIPFDILSLIDKLQNKLFGQHIVQQYVFKAVASHYQNIGNSKKPLVMTFHGTQGTGKNYVATMIAEAVFEKGIESKYFHLFQGSQYQDQEADKIYAHQKAIRKEIFDLIESCPHSVFVFDEVDKMPPKIFDSIASILDHHGFIKGKDFRKSIFIFLTNYGGDNITHILYDHMHKKNLFRNAVELSHFEDPLRNALWNQEGGLKESSLINKAVIDHYVPFLPLERTHVEACIKAEYANFGKNDVTAKMVNEVIKHIPFNRKTNYAYTGCKTIYGKIQVEV